MKNDYYIYEWYNIENGYIFYVGKGRNNRYRIKSGRNNYFANYINKYNCDVRKIKENLTEDDAYNIEASIIIKYKEEGLCCCNLTDGHENPPTLCGEENAMFGRAWYDENTPQEK